MRVRKGEGKTTREMGRYNEKSKMINGREKERERERGGEREHTKSGYIREKTLFAQATASANPASVVGSSVIWRLEVFSSHSDCESLLRISCWKAPAQRTKGVFSLCFPETSLSLSEMEEGEREMRLVSQSTSTVGHRSSRAEEDTAGHVRWRRSV